MSQFAKDQNGAIPVHVVESHALETWLNDQPERVQAWVSASGFKASLGSVVVVPSAQGQIEFAIAGWGDAAARKRDRYHIASIAQKLPAGTYDITSGLTGDALDAAAYAWLLSAYRFTRYKESAQNHAQLLCPKGVDGPRLEAIVAGEFLTRDLINTPASDMGPDDLETAFCALGEQFAADVSIIRGEDLLEQNFPMIHAVGRASDQEPRLLDMHWGDESHPTVTLVGKGVCFDTGGLNIKPASSMGLMKKDMGGSATTLGLAHMIMALELPVRLRVLVPAVENSISAGAYRPQDILKSRKGLTVEINNTDAEGRLVLADALTLADETPPDLLICMATLTGAARVALGPDVPPFYTDDDGLAETIAAAATQTADPLWRMPFWEPYETMIEPGIADLDNAPSGGFAGSITAALFLRRFVEASPSFVHLDLYGWAPSPKPGRTKGGACQSARALLSVIEQRFC